MAEKNNSRNPLVVPLSIFVLLTIGFAITTYYGFAEQAKQRAKANEDLARLKKENEADKASAQADVDELQKRLLAKSKEAAEDLAAKSAEYVRMTKILEDRDQQLEQKQRELERATARKKRKVSVEVVYYYEGGPWPKKKNQERLPIRTRSSSSQ